MPYAIITGEGNGNPLQYSCLENPMDRGAWWTRVHGVAKELDRTEWLNSNHSWLCCHTGALLKTHSEYKRYLINFHSCQVTCIYNTTKISKYANTVFIQLKKSLLYHWLSIAVWPLCFSVFSLLDKTPMLKYVSKTLSVIQTRVHNAYFIKVSFLRTWKVSSETF